MSDVFAKVPVEALNSEVSALLCPRVEEVLNDRGPGHCMRVTDLDDQVMESVCAELRHSQPDSNIFILGGHAEEALPFRITSTKLVELRNPDARGELRSPLLVFIPSTIRTSAEDSFGVATFEELTFPHLYDELKKVLLERLPKTLVGHVRDVFDLLADENWPFADDVARVRYLLTALNNGVDGETLGASLYELTLIPDFKLFADPGLVLAKLRRNINCVRTLMISHKSTRGRILDLHLMDSTLEGTLHTFFQKFDIHEPEHWTPTIALDKSWWRISFDKWVFQEELSLDQVTLSVLETDLPIVGDDETDSQLSGLVGQQVLVPQERRKMNVVFEVRPHPKTVSGLDHFTVQIISQVDGPVGKSKKVKSWAPKRLQCTTTISKLNKIEFEEGWHFVRVLPWTADGDPIPLENASLMEEEDGPRSNESEPFYVLPGGTLAEEPAQRAVPIEQSVEHARFRLQLTALGDERDPSDIQITGVGWSDRSSSRKQVITEVLLGKFGHEGSVQIPVSRALKAIEQRILTQAKHLSGWRMQVNLGIAEPPSEQALEVPKSAALESFLAARELMFTLIRNGNAELISQGFSFRDHANACEEYGQAYLDLVNNLMRQAEASSGKERQQNLQTLRHILAIDSVHVVLTDFRGRHREAVLVSPTHPLRMMWLLGWSALGQNWIDRLGSGSREHISNVREALFGRIAPSAFPCGIPVQDGRVFTPVDNLNHFWSLHAPTTEANSRGLLAEVCAALGIAEPASAGADITGKLVSQKIERYLSQHPYVRELSVNIFNPGTASVVSEALLILQQNREYADMRYDVRLFSVDPDSPVLGESLEAMINPASTINEIADAFATSTGSHLFSKLNLAKHSISEFHAQSQAFKAHLSLLLDVFPAEELSVATKSPANAPLHGLIQEFETEFVDDDSGTFWNKYPVAPLDSKDVHLQFSGLLTSLTRSTCFATAAVSASGGSFSAVPLVTLGLSVPQRELLYEIHRVSDWVFTIDRNMGIEFFDHGGRKNRPDYLIDYVPGASAQATHNLIISSRSTAELEAMLKPVLDRHGLVANSKQAVALLSNLRSLSGQLALKLISASTQQDEALGLALARLYLEYQGALQNQVIVPLDAHIDLYNNNDGSQGVDSEVSLQRTDLALFDLNLADRVITCNLVEVKCYQREMTFSDINRLKQDIASQINQSERILQRHFDPALKNPDRPDRPLKSREFAHILRFYLERSIRYGIMDETASKEALEFLATIDQGYVLQFRRAALVFDFGKSGTEAPDHEVQIEYHRIGSDLIAALLGEIPTTLSGDTDDEAGMTSISECTIASVPKLDGAAFLSPARDHSTRSSEPTWGADFESGTDSIHVEPSDVPPPEEAPIPNNDLVQDEADEPSEQKSAVIDDSDQPSLGDSESEHLTASVRPTQPGSRSAAKKHDYDIMLGVNGDSLQYGLLGSVDGRRIALDLNHTHTISLFGVQGGGKSYTLGSVIEMATLAIDHVSVLPSPLASVIFHYSPTQDYAPEFTSMTHKNTVEEEVRLLKELYDARPSALQDVLILTPTDKVAERRAEFPDVDVRPIAFCADELKASHWKFLMGAIGSQSMYMRQVNLIMRGLRENLTLSGIQQAIESSSLSDHLKDLALTRLQFASAYVDDSARLQDVIQPGRLIIVDLRDEYIEKDEALGLFVVMLQILSEATYNGKQFNKLVVFDEAHKYIENDDLVSGLVEVVREMRHKGTSIMVASQDPPSVPISLIELSTQIIMHKFNSPAWLKHIQKANAALGQLTSEKMSHLGTGEAYVWSSKASDEVFTRNAVKIKCRPRVSQHGGATKTAVKGG